MADAGERIEDERRRKERTGRRWEARGREKGVVVLMLLAGG